MSSLSDLVPAGVITGDDVLTLFDHARTNGYAIPAVNCTRYVGRLATKRTLTTDARPRVDLVDALVYSN